LQTSTKIAICRQVQKSPVVNQILGRYFHLQSTVIEKKNPSEHRWKSTSRSYAETQFGNSATPCMVGKYSTELRAELKKRKLSVNVSVTHQIFHQWRHKMTQNGNIFPNS
jgi:hypothetical protein